MKRLVVQILLVVTGFAVSSSAVMAKDVSVRGKTMAQVKAMYGEPNAVKGPVGGLNEKRPPITQWTYDSFYVTFERNIALHGFEPRG